MKRSLLIAVVVGVLVVVVGACTVIEERVLGYKRGSFESLEAELVFVEEYVVGLVDGVVDEYEFGELIQIHGCLESGGLISVGYRRSVVPRSASVVEVHDALLAEMTERSGSIKLVSVQLEEQPDPENIEFTTDDVGQLGFSAKVDGLVKSIWVQVVSGSEPGLVVSLGTGCYEPGRVESDDPFSLEREEGIQLVGPEMFRSDFDDAG